MDRFVFFSRSVDKPPGEGENEQLFSSPKKYEELAQIRHWRRKLSNSYKSEFELDGLRWLSVEHFYQGSKFKKTKPDLYYKFSLNSGSKISQKLLVPKRRRQTDLTGMIAKFSQHPDLKEALLATKDAQLYHKTLRRAKLLEEVRESLSKTEVSVSLVDSLDFDYRLITKTKKPWGYLYEAEEIETRQKKFIWGTRDITNIENWEASLIQVFSRCPPEVFCIQEIIEAKEVGLVTEYMKGYSMRTLLSLYNFDYDLDHLCILYGVLLRGLNFFHKQGFQHGNIDDIIFSSTTIKIGGIPKMYPINKVLPLRERDTYRISVIIDTLVQERKISKSFRETLDRGIRQKQQILAGNLLGVLLCES